MSRPCPASDEAAKHAQASRMMRLFEPPDTRRHPFHEWPLPRPTDNSSYSPFVRRDAAARAHGVKSCCIIHATGVPRFLLVRPTGCADFRATRSRSNPDLRSLIGGSHVPLTLDGLSPGVASSVVGPPDSRQVQNHHAQSPIRGYSASARHPLSLFGGR